MSEELKQGIAEMVLGLHPGADKAIWGAEFIKLAAEHDDPEINAWIDSRLEAALGSYVNTVRTRREAQRRNERLIARGVSVTSGRLISPSMSVRRSDGARQGVLWVEATPAQFVEAVFREAAVVDGRAESNAIRMQLAALLKSDKQLMKLPTLADVCAELRLDPDTLALDTLPEAI
ncbi:hypothetical protein [Sphaerisporangium sp. TRM90804]|uniref:hypothetical protein n=1 Tax=Sphaerisporangium sp. TRM90804 TaxID=3031113 RepID=UPI00244A48CE|nr:hypothetical protein [Sphaerisporangium sp. TRM90804]MDH2424856.1 hypothetical protein [Sphaerisporangium sp. TRM90804]